MAIVSFTVNRKCLGKNPNGREHHMTKAKRIQSERASVHGCALVQLGSRYREMMRGLTQPLVISFEYVGHRLIDSDNLQSLPSAVRDEIANIIGITDGPTDTRASWPPVSQRKGEDYAVEVRIEGAPEAPAPRFVATVRACP